MADIDFKNGVNVDSAYTDGHKVRLIAIPDGSLELPISATSDSGYVVDANGKKHRVLLATFLNGTPDYKLSPTADSAYMTVDGQKVKVRLVAKLTNSLELPSSANADQGYALGDDSKKHRVTLVATPTGTLELPNSETDDSAYVVDGNGKKHKVRLFFLASGGAKEVIIKGTSPLSLPDAIANSLQYVKAFGGTYQGNIPQQYTQVNYVTNTAQTAVNTGIMIDFAKNYEFEVECRAVSGSWYILQSRASYTGNITGISGSTSGSTITLVVGNVTACTSAITRTVGNKLYVKATLNAGTATLYVKDETANTEDTQTGSYGTSQPNPTAAVYLLGNAGGLYVDVNSDIYMARIKENGVTVMDYVPARQSATAGFYDTVSGIFKTALTPANLSADGNVEPTPDAPIDIVSNNGVLKYGQYGKNLFNKDGTLANGYYKPADGDWVVSAAFRTQDYIKASPNTNYALTVTNLQSGGNFLVMSAWDSGHNWLGTVASNTTSGAAGTSTTITGTTPPNTFYLSVSFAIEYRDINTLQLELGSTATPYEPYYFGIYADGTVETINAHGKNLFDKSDVITGKILNDSGSIINESNGFYSANIPVSPNTTYTASQNSTGGGIYLRVLEYNNVDTMVKLNKGTTGGVQNKTFTTSATTKYVIISGLNSGRDTLQLELGSAATDYVPYFDGGTATAEMLLKVGDYQDVQSIIDGVVTRNVGVKVLDGSENIGTSNATFTVGIADRLPSKIPLVCSHFEYSTKASSQVENLKVISFSSPNIGFRYDACADTTAFKTWLADQYAAGTPVIVVYPLATPTTESVTGQTMQVTAGDNVLEITQASLSGLELEAEYQAAVSLTIQEVQDANLDPNVEVTIN